MRPYSRPPVSGIDAGDPVYVGLTLGVGVPAVYFGIQLAAAPFYPDYSFFTRDASSLGSSASTAAWIFNVGTLLVASMELAAAAALLVALPRAGIGRLLTALTALALAATSLGSMNAFLHPLPDPRHVGGPLAALGRSVVLLPVLASAVLWRLGARRAAVVAVIACLALIPVMTGAVQRVCIGAGFECVAYQSFLNGYHGLI